MKTITLKKLTLQDWRGQNNSVTFGKNTEIKGRNKSGKSSIFNAWLWLLMGVDSSDNANYKLFDEKVEQTHENSKVASVEAVLDIDGVEYTLKKTAEIGWTRKKGREEYERRGTDNYSFLIDNISRNASEYKAFIEETFAPFYKLKLMLNIGHYLGIEWKELRKIFQDLVGEIKYEDFKGDYSIIKNELAKYAPEQIKESIKGQMKPIKQNIEGLPITISTLQSSLPDISGLDTIQQEIDEAKEQIENIDKQLLGSSESVQKYIDKRNEELAKIGELEREYSGCKNWYLGKNNDDMSRIREEISEIDLCNKQIARESDSNKQTIENAKKSLKLATYKLEKMNEYRNTLLKQNDEVKAMEFTDDKCSFCGQELPENMLESAKKKFFEQKDAKHKAIVAEGKANNEKISQCKKEIEELQAIIDKGYVEKPLKDKSELEAKLKKLELEFVPYEQTTEGKEKMAVISNMKANLTVVPASDTTALQNMKKELLNEIETNSKKLGLKGEYDKQVAKIAQFQSELKDSAAELALLEGKLNAVERYEREKASIISYRVNSKFDYLHVEMTETNKSGNIVDTCKVTDNMGISASVTNHASKVLIGIDLALALQKFYDVNLPLFIDDADLINSDNMPNMDNQLVKLIVTNEDFCVECK